MSQNSHPPGRGADPPTAPLVTIMIPTYGQAHYLPRAIDSALAQDYPNLEILVVDDASPDDTASVIEPYLEDPRFRYHRHDENLGRVATYRDTLEREALGDYVLNLDGDDWLVDPTYLSSAMDLVRRHPEVAMVFARAASFDQTSGELSENELNRGRPAILDGSEIIEGFADGSAGIPHLTAVYRRDLAVEVGFYQTDIIGADSLSFIRLLPRRRVGFLDRVVAVWRVHERNASRRSGVGELLANLALPDEAASHLTDIGFFDRTAAAAWRRRFCAHLGYRQLANFLVERRFESALHYLYGMLRQRPVPTMGAVAQVLVAGARRFGRRAKWPIPR